MGLKQWSIDLAQRSLDGQEAQLRRLAQRWRTVVRAVFLAMGIAIWVAFFESMAHEHRLTLAAVAARDGNLAKAVEHYSVRVLRTARAVHGLLGIMVAQGRSDAELVQMLADRQRANDVLDELAICRPGGQMLPAPSAGGLLDSELCQRALRLTHSGADVTVLAPVGSGATLHLPAALQLRDDQGRFLGVAVALIAVENLLGVMQSAHLGDETVVQLVGNDGVPRAAWRSRTGHVTDPGGFEALSDLSRAASTTARVDGREYLLSSHSVPPLRLRVVVASASADALAGYRERRTRLLLLCAVMSAGLAGAYVLLARMNAEGLERGNALNAARAELQALNISLDRQVQERTEQLQQAYRDLETFSYAVAHDVRAPLAGIAGFADALQPLVEDAGSEKHRHYLRRIKANTTHMDELARGLLELGRLSRAPLERREVNLTSLAHEVAARLGETGEEREVEVDIEPGLTAHGDAALLRQVLENLLGNAWKFSARRPRARIELRSERQDVLPSQSVFAVHDNGEGFDDGRAGSLFQPFSRLHKSSEFPGTGVGLAAVRRIIALHGGQVWCRSRPGEGASFYFSLPAAAG